MLCEHEIYSGAYPDIQNESDPDYERNISLLDLFITRLKAKLSL